MVLVGSPALVCIQYDLITPPITLCTTNPSPNTQLVVLVECTPGFGVISFLSAYWVSMVINHCMVHLHRQVVAADKALLDVRSHSIPPTPMTPLSPLLEVSDEEREEEVDDLYPITLSTVVRRSNKVAWVCIWMLFFVWPFFLAFGYVLKSYYFQVDGLSGFLVENIGDHNDRRRPMSLVSLVKELVTTDEIHYMNQPGKWLIIVSYVCFTIITPMSLFLGCLYIWSSPHTHAQFRRTKYFLRLLYSWNGLEVFCITAFINVVQISAYFNSLMRLIKFCPQILGDGLSVFGVKKQEAVCFNVSAQFLPVGFVVVSLLGFTCVLGYHAVMNRLAIHLKKKL